MITRRFGGTGLGLAISRSLCELMGHRLEASSVEGVGTIMRIRLNAATRLRIRTPTVAQLVPELPRMRDHASTTPRS